MLGHSPPWLLRMFHMQTNNRRGRFVNNLHKVIQFYKQKHRNMPAYSPIRRSTRHVGKVINYNKQADKIDQQIKDAVRTDKRKYREDWKRQEKEFDDYIRSLTAPKTPKPPRVYKWEDQYETMEALRDDIAKVLKLNDPEKEKIINDSLEKAKTQPIHMVYLAHFVKYTVLKAEDDARFWEREWERREQEEKDREYWCQERKEKLTKKMNKLIEQDFGIADIFLRIVEDTSNVDTTEDPSIDELPFKSLYKLRDYVVYASKKMQNEKRRARRHQKLKPTV